MSQKKNTSSPSIERSVVKVDTTALDRYFAEALEDRNPRPGEFTVQEAMARWGKKKNAAKNQLRKDVAAGILKRRQVGTAGSRIDFYSLAK